LTQQDRNLPDSPGSVPIKSGFRHLLDEPVITLQSGCTNSFFFIPGWLRKMDQHHLDEQVQHSGDQIQLSLQCLDIRPTSKYSRRDTPLESDQTGIVFRRRRIHAAHDVFRRKRRVGQTAVGRFYPQLLAISTGHFDSRKDR
jgi:hypothetical protein